MLSWLKNSLNPDVLLETVADAALSKARPFLDSIIADARAALLAEVTAEPPSSFPDALDRAGFKDLSVDVQRKLWSAVVDALATMPAPPAEEADAS
jgi:hypothetical protein